MKKVIKRTICIMTMAGVISQTLYMPEVSHAAENNVAESFVETTSTESTDTYIVMAESSETQEYIVDTYAESTENISGEYEYIPEEDYEIVHLEEDDIQEIQENCDDVIIEKDSTVKASGIKRATKKETFFNNKSTEVKEKRIQ